MSDAKSSSIASVEAQQEFEGWEGGQETPIARLCARNLEFQVSDTYAVCCPEGTCKVSTRCYRDNTIVDESGSSKPCEPDHTCSTMRLMESSVTDTDAETQAITSIIACYTNLSMDTLYRAFPEVAAATATAIDIAHKDTQATTTRSSSSEPSRTDAEGDSSNAGGSDGSDDGSDGGSTSKAWIAGPVVGAIVFVVLAVGLAFWLLRKRAQKKEAAVAEVSGTSVNHKGGIGAYQQDRSETTSERDQSQYQTAPPQRAELPSERGTTELDAGFRASELPG